GEDELSEDLHGEMDRRDERWEEASRVLAEVASGHPSKPVRDVLDELGRKVNRYLDALNAATTLALNAEKAEAAQLFDKPTGLRNEAWDAVKRATDALHVDTTDRGSTD